MRNYVKAELLKQKRCFSNILVFGMPIVTLFIAYVLSPYYIQTMAFNFWYILLLPFTFSFIASTMIKRERKYHIHGLFGIVEDKKKLWYGKVIIAIGYLFVTCMIFGILNIACGLLLNEQITPLSAIKASLVLVVTFAWQIPLYMMLALKTSVIVSLIVSIGCNFLVACICAVGQFWWIPFAIPARLMCSVINVMPNGLLLEQTNPFASGRIIAVGILISIALFFLVTYMTAKLFERQEA
ncbi:MAG: lantibiotic immunity ABC transporter MutE/EpiE family permease subunit [Lachnospiraceae bacterium]|nr:lantibiotic immunity ABC transporter MutE/EpiE family permease subunit [Lachnospiraceae bacterium]